MYIIDLRLSKNILQGPARGKKGGRQKRTGKTVS